MDTETESPTGVRCGAWLGGGGIAYKPSWDSRDHCRLGFVNNGPAALLMFSNSARNKSAF